MNKKHPARWIIISGVVILIVVLIIAGAWYVPRILKQKITAYVNHNTGFYLDISSIHFNGLHSIECRNVQFRHKQDKIAYIKNKGYQTDWISCRFNAIILAGINWKELILHKRIILRNATIVYPEIYVYRDKRIPNHYLYKALPSALLRDAKFSLTIPAFEINTGTIIYEEVSGKTGKSIIVFFTDLHATGDHISTDSLYLAQQPEMVIEASGLAFDSIKTAMIYKANTLDKNNGFSVTGNMGLFSARTLNQCLEPAADAIIENGFINEINFKFTGDEQQAQGKIDMDYKELKVKMLKKEDGEKNVVKSILANIFIRNKDKNAGNAPGSYSGKINFKRRKDRFIFNYWWNAFKSGVISAVIIVPVEAGSKK